MPLPSRVFRCFGIALLFALTMPMSVVFATGDWKDPAAAMVAKIAPVLGDGTSVSLAVRNISSLDDDDVALIRRLLRAELRRQGLRFVAAARATASVQVTLSENPQSFLWVAEIQKGDSRTVSMLSVRRAPANEPAPKSAILAIWKTTLISLDEPILDLAVVEAANEGTTRLLVLAPDKVVAFAMSGTSWQLNEPAAILEATPVRPRDPRGRLVMRADNAFDAFLPGLKCSGAVQPALKLECHAGDDYWPLAPSAAGAPLAQFAASANYFSGKISSTTGEVSVPPFFSAAEFAVKDRALWAYAGLDSRVQILAKGPEPVAVLDGWGSDIVGLKTGCGSGWQILATRAGDYTTADAIQAFEIAGRQAVAVSAPLEFSGPVSALWAEPDGTTAIVVSLHLGIGKYEASKLSISCGH